MVKYTSHRPSDRATDLPPAMASFFQPDGRLTDEFTIDPAYDQYLTDRNNTQWLIPGQALRDSQGHVPGQFVSIQITSLSDPRQALLAGYSMSSGELPLQTSALFYIQAGSAPDAYQITRPITVSAPWPKIHGPLSLFSATTTEIISSHRNGMLSWRKSTQKISTFTFGRKRSIELKIPGSGIYAVAQKVPARLARTMLTVRAYGLPETLHAARAFLLIDASFPPLQLHQTAPLDFSGFNLPSGKAAWLLVVGTRGDQFFYGLRRLAPLHNRVESIDLKPIRASQLRAIIQNILL